MINQLLFIGGILLHGGLFYTGWTAANKPAEVPGKFIETDSTLTARDSLSIYHYDIKAKTLTETTLQGDTLNVQEHCALFVCDEVYAIVDDCGHSLLMSAEFGAQSF
jgi:hypothetical protein